LYDLRYPIITIRPTAYNIEKQEGLAVARIVRDDPSPLPGMHHDHNAPACMASHSERPHALRVRARTVNLDWNLKPKLAIMCQCTSVTDRWTYGQTDGH